MSSDLMIATTIAGFPALETTNESKRPPVLFIHGAFATHLPWAGWMEEFAKQGWHCVAAAMRGRLGIGPERARGVKIADYVADTLKVIDTLDQLPIVVGHSMGGLVAQKIAELGKCRALVLLAPAPAGKLPAQPVALPALLPMMPKILAGLPMLPTRSGCARIVLNRMPPDQCPIIHNELVHESGKVYREMIFGQVAEKIDPTSAFKEQLHGRDIPVEDVGRFIKEAIESMERWKPRVGEGLAPEVDTSNPDFMVEGRFRLIFGFDLA